MRSILGGLIFLLFLPAVHGVCESSLPDAPQAAAKSASTPDALAIPVDEEQGYPGRMSFADKSRFYLHHEVSWRFLLIPALEAGYSMARPKKNYPPEWRQGAAAYGRNFGSTIGRHVTGATTKYLVGVALHEDPRYFPSPNPGLFPRTLHAVAFTLIDRSDSDHPMPAISNLADAAAGGFVGNAFLPDGYTDLTHAAQRSELHLIELAAFNVVHEFTPELDSLRRRTLTIFHIY